MNRPMIQTQRSATRQSMLHRLVVLFFYALLIFCLSAATLVVLDQQSPSRMVARVPSSQAAWVNVASSTPGEGRI